MDYELAKKLKDAGFPQRHLNNKTDFDGDKSCISYVPTLSELIEVCGDSLRWIKHNIHDKKIEWMAQGCQSLTGHKGKDIRCRAETIEEAVAKLWLEIKKEV